MNFNKLIPELSVTDINKTREFYVDVLGFKICYERPEDKFIFVEKDGNQIMLEQINDNWNVGKMEYPFGRGINFEMTISDVDAVYERIEKAGMKLFRKMEVKDYECGNETVHQKQFLIQDPDGYLLRFVDGAE